MLTFSGFGLYIEDFAMPISVMAKLRQRTGSGKENAKTVLLGESSFNRTACKWLRLCAIDDDRPPEEEILLRDAAAAAGYPSL